MTSKSTKSKMIINKSPIITNKSKIIINKSKIKTKKFNKIKNQMMLKNIFNSSFFQKGLKHPFLGLFLTNFGPIYCV